MNELTNYLSVLRNKTSVCAACLPACRAHVCNSNTHTFYGHHGGYGAGLTHTYTVCVTYVRRN